ncbi:MAG: hypothetical protein AABZ60_22615 [Planctomycetota bacterium]
MAISGVNLLNRTCFSTGFYRVRDLAVAANQGNIKILGISDDFFVTPISKECRSKKDFDRLFIRDIYHQHRLIQELRPEFSTMEIYFGAIVDLPFNMGNLPYMAQFTSQFNYLLFKNVHQDNIEYFFEHRKRFQCPIGLCQNNLKESFPKFNIERLIQVFNQNKIFIELDTRLPYFLENNKFFARVRGTPIRVTIGTDTDQDLSEVSQIHLAAEYIERFGLENNLLMLNLGHRGPFTGPRPPYQRNSDYRRPSRPRFYQSNRPNKEFRPPSSTEKPEFPAPQEEIPFSQEIESPNHKNGIPPEKIPLEHPLIPENKIDSSASTGSEVLPKNLSYSTRPQSINRDYRSHRNRNP